MKTSKELEILIKVSTALSQSLDIDTVLDLALDETMQTLRVNNGGIYLFDPVSGKLMLRVNHNLTAAFITAKGVVGTDEGCAGTAYNTKKVFSGYGTPEKQYICADAQALMGIDCLAAAPVIFKDEVLGILELFAPVDRKLSMREISLLNSICSQIGVAVANANSHQALKHALKDSKLLLEASKAIVSSLNLDDVLERLLNLVSELTHISRASIWLLSQADRAVTLAHEFESLLPGFTISVDELPSRLRDVIYTQNTSTIEDFSNAADRIHKLADRLSLKSLLAVPMIFKGKVKGLLTLDKPGLQHTFSQEETDLAEGIASHAAIAIENAATYEEQHQIAQTLQKSLVPMEKPDVPGYEIGIRYEAATRGTLVGGDFYDFINLNGNLAMIIGDVSGKGVEAATFTGIVKNTVRILTDEGMAPAPLITKANRLIVGQVEKNKFVTLVFGYLEKKSGLLVYTNAGHPLGLLFSRKKNDLERLGCTNPPVGIIPDHEFSESSTKLNSGDCLLLYTDGIIEARRGNQAFGEERLEEIFIRSLDKSADQIAGLILKKAAEFSRDHLVDDIAIMVIKRVSSK